ncbi:MAG: hypothetical protein WA131_00120 [Desulfitobacteriaceae bacterium]
MKKTVIILSLLSIILAGILAGYGIFTFKTPNKVANLMNAKAVDNKNVSNSNTYGERILTINSETDVLKIFKSIDDLFANSDFLIQGKVINAQTVYKDSNIYMDATVQVLDDFVGNIGVNQNINVIFRGGTLEGSVATEFASNIYKEKFGKESIDPLPNKIVQNINGLENIENGDTVILFLQDKSAQSAGKDKYVLTGAYQGRFKVKDKNVELHEELNNAKNSQLFSIDKRNFDKDALIKHLRDLKK